MVNQLGGGSGGSVGSGGSLGGLIGEVRTWFGNYIKVIDESDLDVLALWAIHTWVCEETYTTPRLLIDSPVPGSGKTTLLEHLGKLSRRPAQMASINSSAMLARITANEIRTLLIDEADRNLNPKKPGVEDLIAILNSGYKRGGTRPTLVQSKNDWVVQEMPTFSPVAIAGNTPLLPDDTRSRCIVVRLLPDIAGLVQPSDWEFLDEPAAELAQRIEQVTEEHRGAIRVSRPELPPGCVNRLKERWNPLKRIAAVAGAQWSERVDQLILRDIESARQQSENGDLQLSVNLQLAKDLFAVFGAEPGFIPTVQLVTKLIRHNPDQWSISSFYGKDLTPQRFGRILANAYGLNSVRIGDSARGYHSDQFKRIWQQLGITPLEPTEPTEPTEPPGGDLF
jgi:hypothetical protein